MKLSLILMCWNTSHLLARTLQTLQKQTLDDWELIVVDDMSEDDVPLVLRQNGEGLPIKYHRLEHEMGMRGNTVSLNYGIEQARGYVVMWSTPEVMLPPGALWAAYEAHIRGEVGRKLGAKSCSPLWVTIPSHGLTAELQLCIDKVDWESDLHNIEEMALEFPPSHWNSIWFYLNFYQNGRRGGPRKLNYGNNQTVAVAREEWLDTVGSFPLFCDYGSDDPWISRERGRHGYTDVTLWNQEGYHQWHTTCQYWMAQGKAPNWNAKAHTTSNVANDPRIEARGGTCEIWDHGDRSPMTEAQIEDALRQGPMVAATGFRPRVE